MNSFDGMLPGFDNVRAKQWDEDTLFLVVDRAHVYSGDDEARLTVRRSDYDSDQEFAVECIQWARRNGGIPTAHAQVAAAVVKARLARLSLVQ